MCLTASALVGVHTTNRVCGELVAGEGCLIIREWTAKGRQRRHTREWERCQGRDDSSPVNHSTAATIANTTNNQLSTLMGKLFHLLAKEAAASAVYWLSATFKRLTLSRLSRKVKVKSPMTSQCPVHCTVYTAQGTVYSPPNVHIRDGRKPKLYQKRLNFNPRLCSKLRPAAESFN